MKHFFIAIVCGLLFFGNGALCAYLYDIPFSGFLGMFLPFVAYSIAGSVATGFAVLLFGFKIVRYLIGRITRFFSWRKSKPEPKTSELLTRKEWVIWWSVVILTVLAVTLSATFAFEWITQSEDASPMRPLIITAFQMAFMVASIFLEEQSGE